MNKRQNLGQHFLNSQPIAQSIVLAAKISSKDIVLEIGPGKGILIPLLCKKAKKVISIEADNSLYNSIAKQFQNISNLEIRHGDGFKTTDDFNIFVSNLPYSKSRKAMEWIIQKKFSHAVVMVQKEFAEKLLKQSNQRRAISVLTQHALEIEKIMNVSKNNFSPPPKVDSVLLLLKRKKTLSSDLIKIVNQMFSFRRKTIQNIFKNFGQVNKSEKRLDDLKGDEIIKIAKQLVTK